VSVVPHRISAQVATPVDAPPKKAPSPLARYSACRRRIRPSPASRSLRSRQAGGQFPWLCNSPALPTRPTCANASCSAQNTT